MSRLTDQEYLRSEQYGDAKNLNARAYVHRRFSTNDYPWQRWVFDRFDLPERCDILDVGCGPGDLWLENGERIPRGWRVTLSDLSVGMIHEAMGNLGGNPNRFSPLVFDAQAIPLPDESVDVVVANHMLYHVPDRDAALYEFSRVLRAGGQLYAATNGLDHLRELGELVGRFCVDADTANVATAFGLENGATQLLNYFPHVTRHRQENALVVTEAEPIIAYTQSMMAGRASMRNLEALVRWVRERIAAQGAIHIQKDAGLLVAKKA